VIDVQYYLTKYIDGKDEGLLKQVREVKIPKIEDADIVYRVGYGKDCLGQYIYVYLSSVKADVHTEYEQELLENYAKQIKNLGFNLVIKDGDEAW